MAAPSTTEVLLRDQLTLFRSELLAFEKQKSHYESKLETYDKETRQDQKATESYQHSVASVHAKLDEINKLIDARNVGIPQLEAAIRQVAIDTALLVASQRAHPQHVQPQVSVPNKLPDLQRTLFYGRSDEKANDWINCFKAYVAFYSLNDWQAVRGELLVHMKGSAFAWFEDRVFDSLDDFFRQFRHEYGERLVQDRLVKQLHAMAPTTHLAEYVRSFRATYKLLDAAHRDLVWIRFAFINGVPDHMLADVSSSVLNAKSVDAMFDCCADVGHIKSGGSAVGDIEMNAFPRAESKVTEKDFKRKCKCYRCTGFGHMANECPSQRVKSGGVSSSSGQSGPGSLRE